MKKTEQLKQPDVSGFDYQKMAAQSDSDAIYEKEKKHFAEYKQAESKVFANDKVDYEMWLASGTFEKVTNRRTGQVETRLIGIKLNGNKHIGVTRLTRRAADELNKHVSLDRHTSKYYLLATAANIEVARRESEVEHVS